MDLAKAFDTVSVPILVKKLELVGIRDNALRLLQDYLTGRTQRTKVGDVISDEETITYGVPQGSVLGPSLFLVYVNDLCNLNLDHGSIFSYADDTALIFVGKDWEQVRNYAEKGLRVVTSWLQDNLLSLNVEKTKYITFTNSRVDAPNLNIRTHANCSTSICNCPVLERVRNIRYLGVTLDSKMTWKPHIHTLSSRVRKLIYIFKHLREVADRKLIFDVYNALCRSILTYCNTSWGGASGNHMLTLERAQRAVLKVATYKPFRFPTTELYNDCRVLTVRQLFVAKLLFVQHRQTYLLDRNRLDRQRRKDNIFKRLKCNTKLAQRHQEFLGPFLYNNTSKILKNLMFLSHRDAKSTVDSWLHNLSYAQTEQLLKVTV